MKKSIKNADAITCKLGLALTRTTNQKLEVARKEKEKREEMVERQKIVAMAIKCPKARGEIILFSEEKKNYRSESGDRKNSNQFGNNKNPLQF